MIHIGLYYDVKPGKESEFEKIFHSVTSQLGGEDGFVSGILYRRVDEPNSYMILSEWKSLEHFKRFVTSRPFKEVTNNNRSILMREPYNKVFNTQ
ncbi:MAG: antibiotic biosynthesis monooxygenase [Candidatus Marsarchaeota archaeon]|nr:antibiotic biosynthesis monooxygenase [Candidatus Marsarchaeota archaeon]